MKKIFLLSLFAQISSIASADNLQDSLQKQVYYIYVDGWISEITHTTKTERQPKTGSENFSSITVSQMTKQRLFKTPINLNEKQIQNLLSGKSLLEKTFYFNWSGFLFGMREGKRELVLTDDTVTITEYPSHIPWIFNIFISALAIACIIGAYINYVSDGNTLFSHGIPIGILMITYGVISVYYDGEALYSEYTFLKALLLPVCLSFIPNIVLFGIKLFIKKSPIKQV